MADRENSQLESETGIKPYQLPYTAGMVTKINRPGDLAFCNQRRMLDPPQLKLLAE
jgi:hypothetical protein